MTISKLEEAVADDRSRGAVRVEAKPGRAVHLTFLDGLRAIAAMYVAVFHIYMYYVKQIPARTLPYTSVLDYGHYSVDLFIVVSGFCLMLPVVRNGDNMPFSVTRFFQRRARRMLPPYYAAMLLSCALIWLWLGHKTGTIWDISIPVTKKGILLHVLLLHDAFKAYWSQINSPFWSVAVEWRIYLAFPLLVLSWRRFGPYRTAIGAVALAYALAFAFLHVGKLTHINSQNNGITPQYLGLFTLGMLGAGLSFAPSLQNAPLRRPPLLSGIILASVAAVALIKVRMPEANTNLYCDIFVGLCSMSVIVLSATQDGRLRRVLSGRALTFIGTFAYSLYLTHWLSIQIVWRLFMQHLHLPPTQMLLAHIAIGLPFALLVSYLFFLVFERPFLNSRPEPRRERVA